MTVVQTIENQHWQVGIVPETGAGIAFGRIRYNGVWVDVLRPTAEADYGNSSKNSSFIMLPWANRIRDGKFTFEGQSYQLETTKDDGTARHGDVRKRIWEVEETHSQALRLSFDSSAHLNVNFPFAFSAQVEYTVEKRDFIIRLLLRNDDTRAMPGGFGHHPYFVRPGGTNTPHLQVPCDRYFELPPDYMPVTPPSDIIPRLDFRMTRPVEDDNLNDLLTGRMGDDPVRLVYPAWETEIVMSYDALFQHILIYTPANEASIAIEPMTMASDGFNLMAKGIAGHGTFVLQPGESQEAVMSLHVKSTHE
jgi:aldose 1-epimerase